MGREKKDTQELHKKRVTIRFTYNDYIKVIKKKPTNLTDSEYFRTIILTKEVVFLDYNKLDKVMIDIRKIGTNINQIAKKINSFGTLDANDNYILRSQIVELNSAYNKIVETINEK